MKEISRTIVQQINELHARFIALGGDVGEKIVEYVNAGREIGLNLQTLRANEPQWQQLVLLDAGHVGAPGLPHLTINEMQAKTFLRLAERMKDAAFTPAEAMSSMKDVMMLQGTLPFPDGHGRQQLHDKDPLSQIIRHAMEIQATWNKDVKGGVMRAWDSARRQHARDQIEPVKRAIDAIVEELAA